MEKLIGAKLIGNLKEGNVSTVMKVLKRMIITVLPPNLMVEKGPNKVYLMKGLRDWMNNVLIDAGVEHRKATPEVENVAKVPPTKMNNGRNGQEGWVGKNNWGGQNNWGGGYKGNRNNWNENAANQVAQNEENKATLERNEKRRKLEELDEIFNGGMDGIPAKQEEDKLEEH